MKNIQGILFALISSGTFGLIPLFSLPLIQGGMGVPSILFYRFLFSTIIIGGVCLLEKRCFKVSLKTFGIMSVLGIFYAATAMALVFSYLYIPSGVATTIHFLYPILVTLIMVAFFKEKRSIALLLAAIISLAGVALLCWSGEATLNPMGIFIALMTVVTYATYIVGINKSGVGKMDSHILTFYILLFGAFAFGIFAWATTGVEGIHTGGEWLNLILLAFFPTVVSDLTLILAIKYAGSTTTSILGSMEPLVAVCVGVLFFREDFGWNSLIGLLFVLASVTMVILLQARREVKGTG